MPKVSVVIPTYNRAHLITEAIQSVQDQTFQDFEIIVIDDGSTDNTAEIVSAFPVRYLWQENQKVPVARNKGIELSCGEYIAFLDSDDILLKDALEKGVEVLDRHPEAGFSYGQVYLTDEKGHIFALESTGSKYSSVREGREEIRKFLTSGNHVTTSTLMIRRSCLQEVGGCDPAFSSGSSDVELWVRLAKEYAVAYIAEPLAKFRNHSQKFCWSRSLKEWEETNSFILESIFNDAELGPLFSHLRPNAYFCLYSGLAFRAARGRGDGKTARHYLRKALRVYPQIVFQRDGISILYAYKYATLLLPKGLWLALRNLKWRFLGLQRELGE